MTCAWNSKSQSPLAWPKPALFTRALPEAGGFATVDPVPANLEEVKKQIEALPAEEVFELKDWLLGKADAWDRQMIEDIKAGRLQPLLQGLDAEIAAGEVTEGFKRA